MANAENPSSPCTRKQTRVKAHAIKVMGRGNTHTHKNVLELLDKPHDPGTDHLLSA